MKGLYQHTDASSTRSRSCSQRSRPLCACVCLRGESTTCLIRVYYSGMVPTIHAGRHSPSLFTDVMCRERPLTLSLSLGGPISTTDQEVLWEENHRHRGARHTLGISTGSFNRRARFRSLFPRGYLLVSSANYARDVVEPLTPYVTNSCLSRADIYTAQRNYSTAPIFEYYVLLARNAKIDCTTYDKFYSCCMLLGVCTRKNESEMKNKRFSFEASL